MLGPSRRPLLVLSLLLPTAACSGSAGHRFQGTGTPGVDAGTGEDATGPEAAGQEAEVGSEPVDPRPRQRPCDTDVRGQARLAVPSTAGRAVAYQIDVAHSGNQPTSQLKPPLVESWQVDLEGDISYPLIVDGRVFVTVSNLDLNRKGTRLFALDLATGKTLWGPIDLGGTYWWSGTAYDDGRIFAVNDEGLLSAHDAARGIRLWETQLPDEWLFSSPPSAAGGMVFVTGAGIGGTVYAVAADTGTLRWSTPIHSGDNSSPALATDGLFVSSACELVNDLDPQTGCLVWERIGRCFGGGGATPVIDGDLLWVIGGAFPSYEDTTNTLLDRRTGTALGIFESTRMPAVSEGMGFFVTASKLSRIDAATKTPTWTFTAAADLMAPVVANGYVYTASLDGTLVANDVRTGSVVWSTKVAPDLPPLADGVGSSFVQFGIGASETSLIVPGRSVLHAFH